MSAAIPKLLVSRRVVAEMLSVSYGKVKALERAGKLKAVVFGTADNAKRLYSRAEVEALARAGARDAA